MLKKWATFSLWARWRWYRFWRRLCNKLAYTWGRLRDLCAIAERFSGQRALAAYDEELGASRAYQQSLLSNQELGWWYVPSPAVR